jgi:hypothetical protein
MTDGTRAPQSAERASDHTTSLSESGFPNEVFPCPACGQMLGPLCRVCVACKKPIDPAQIKAASARALQLQPFETQPATGPATGNVRFPWLLFSIVLLLGILAAGLVERRWGWIRAELVLDGVKILCSAWVFYDANRRGVPRPLRWVLGALFLWPIVFPWYLVRRKTPRTPCPFVEGIGMPVVILVLLALGVLIVLIRGPIK